MTENELKWHIRFLELGNLVASWSKDPSSKIGAVIVDADRRVVSTGYNGFPVGVADIEDRYLDRETKYRMILHAEENAIMFSKRNLSNCSLYVTGLPPCSHCAALIVQSGIKDVFAPVADVPDRWKPSVELTKTMFREAGVRLIFVDVPLLLRK